MGTLKQMTLGIGMMMSSWAYATGAGPCQLNESQRIENFAFKMEYQQKKGVWTAEKKGEELLLAQTQYFTGKKSPFIKGNLPAELGYYDPHVAFNIIPYVTYSLTVDGRQCAKVQGVKLVIVHAPEFMLANELNLNSCVAKESLNHQLKHHEIAVKELQEIAEAKEIVKKMIFPTYESKGAAGKTVDEIRFELKNMERAATTDLSNLFFNNIKIKRRQEVETRTNFINLYNSCNGEFQKAANLVNPTVKEE